MRKPSSPAPTIADGRGLGRAAGAWEPTGLEVELQHERRVWVTSDNSVWVSGEGGTPIVGMESADVIFGGEDNDMIEVYEKINDGQLDQERR